VEPVAEPKTAPINTAAVEKKTDTSAKAKPVAARSSDAEKLSKGWVVQVGTFANADNAERLREKLQSQGYSVKSESVTIQGSKAMRLRVGPYRDKTSAAKVQTQLHKDLNIQGVVLAYP
jgi:DedD protein